MKKKFKIINLLIVIGFAMGCSDQSETENLRSILELFNSPENKHGDYLQLIIAAKVARDGINLANTVRGYIVSPTWHESGSHQALSRFIRATSHEELLKETSCLLYTSPSPRDRTRSRMPSSA